MAKGYVASLIRKNTARKNGKGKGKRSSMGRTAGGHFTALSEDSYKQEAPPTWKRGLKKQTRKASRQAAKKSLSRGNPAKLEHLAGWEGAGGMSLEDLIGTQGTQIPGLRKARRAVKRGSTKSKKSTQSYRHDAESQRLLGHDAGMAMGMRLLEGGQDDAYIRAYAAGVAEALAWREHAMATYNPRRR